MKEDAVEIGVINVRNQGFTLIELIVVIVILGILSAFALPRFADLTSQASVASLNGALGAIRSAANIARAEQLTIPGSTLDTDVVLDGVTVTMAGGAPTADTAGILNAAQINQDGNADYLIGDAFGGTAPGSALIVCLPPEDATSCNSLNPATICRVTYVSADLGGTPPTPFTTLIQTDDC